ncbi:MAG: chemotaxis protein CheX [Candidatus Omnitrophica bacterium]|nr:chemotaxis protein CheX [Candidatus Omnitrophota bacterium]
MEIQDQVYNAIRDSVANTLETTLSLSPELLQQDGSGAAIAQDDVIASCIDLEGGINGKLCVSFDNNSACRIVSKMLGMDIEEINNDVYDGVGEILNMIAGGMKMSLAKTDVGVNIGLPVKSDRASVREDIKQDESISINEEFRCPEDISFSVILKYKLDQKDAGQKKEPPSTTTKTLSPLDKLNMLLAKQNTEKKEDNTNKQP